MDPNQALEGMRATAAAILDGERNGKSLSYAAYVDVAEELALLVESLDQWLASGGFAPKDWTDSE